MTHTELHEEHLKQIENLCKRIKLLEKQVKALASTRIQEAKEILAITED